MKLRLASGVLLALLGVVPARADNTRRRDVFDLTRLEHLRTIEKGWSHSLSPSGLAFAVFEGNNVRIHDTVEGRLVHTLAGHVAPVHDSAWSRDGRYIATSGYDAVVHVWDVTTGKSILILHPHAAYACSVAFSPDGKWLATGGSEDGMVKIYDLATGRAIRVIPTPDMSIYSMAFTPDAATIVVNHSLANRADSSIRIFRTADASEVRNVATGPVSAFALSRDGRLLAFSNLRGAILLYETGGWTELRRLEGHQTGASSIAFHPVSRYLASTGRDGAVKIWDTDSGRVVKSLTTKAETDSRLIFGTDGMSLVVSS